MNIGCKSADLWVGGKKIIYFFCWPPTLGFVWFLENMVKRKVEGKKYKEKKLMRK